MPSVIGGENNDRLLGEPQLLQALHYSPHRFINTLDHRRVSRVAMMFSGGLLLVLGNDLFLRLEWCMHRVMGQVQEERAVLILLDERDRLVGQAISKVFPIFSIRERVPTRKRMFRSHAPLAIIREEIVARVAHVVPAHIEIETLMLRIKLPIPANMPLAHGSRDIPGILECLGNRDLFQGQILFVDCLKQRKRFFNPLCSLDRNRMGNVQAPRVFPGEDTCPRR